MPGPGARLGQHRNRARGEPLRLHMAAQGRCDRGARPHASDGFAYRWRPRRPRDRGHHLPLRQLCHRRDSGGGSAPLQPAVGHTPRRVHPRGRRPGARRVGHRRRLRLAEPQPADLRVRRLAEAMGLQEPTPGRRGQAREPAEPHGLPRWQRPPGGRRQQPRDQDVRCRGAEPRAPFPGPHGPNHGLGNQRRREVGPLLLHGRHPSSLGHCRSFHPSGPRHGGASRVLLPEPRDGDARHVAPRAAGHLPLEQQPDLPWRGFRSCRRQGRDAAARKSREGDRRPPRRRRGGGGQ
mmetsp:Transcript_15949/g.37795  ORF Transcript_15949/g.37795 Transcript_15949/m.37795 type:complete len:293 (+) Transcript_15949:213-1091(+)